MNSEFQTTTLRTMKADNQRLLLRMLHKNGTLSRKELAEKSGLTPAAVSKLTAALISAGYMKETGKADSHAGAGRKEIRLQTTLGEQQILGIYMELNTVTMSVLRMDGAKIVQQQYPFSGDLQEVLSQTRQFLKENSAGAQRLRCVGVCVMGSADDSTLPLNANVVQSAFESLLGLPVAVENNIKAFVLAQKCYGSADISNRALFFKWGPGVGSALYAGGNVLSGDAGHVAEIGHYIVDPAGVRCRCGRYGCLETVCAENVLLKETGVKDLDRLLHSRSPAVGHLLDQKINTVAIALTNTSTIFSTKHIVLFGSMFQNSVVAQKLKKQMLRYNQNLAEEKIVLSDLNAGISVYSPAAVCAERFFFSLQKEEL